MEYKAFRMAEMAEGQKPAIICLSKNNCSQGIKNKATLTKILGKARDPIKIFFFDPYTSNFKPDICYFNSRPPT